jgi:hypothetical protein
MTGFLARWSQRKRAAQPEPHPPGPTAPETPDIPLPADAAPLPPDEPADLPSLDDLTPRSDISAFLRAGVPEALRNAALRRMWSLDPDIRDFAGHARDYAYDWNVPGGAPGSGALLPSDDVNGMVERIFGVGHPRADDPPGDAPAPRSGAMAGPGPTPKTPGTAPQLGVAEAPQEPSPASAETSSSGEEAPEPVEGDSGRSRVRRHGGAAPSWNE